MKKIGDLTEIELVRLLLRRLWQHHDNGGISMGRTLENRLLESAMDQIPMPKGVNLDQWDDHELIEEADRRSFDRGVAQQS